MFVWGETGGQMSSPEGKLTDWQMDFAFKSQVTKLIFPLEYPRLVGLHKWKFNIASRCLCKITLQYVEMAKNQCIMWRQKQKCLSGGSSNVSPFPSRTWSFSTILMWWELCLPVGLVTECVPNAHGGQRGVWCQSPCNWSYRPAWASMWVLGIVPGSSLMAGSTLATSAISSIPQAAFVWHIGIHMWVQLLSKIHLYEDKDIDECFRTQKMLE